MNDFSQIKPTTNERRFWVIDLERVRPKKPTGYMVRFHTVTEVCVSPNGTISSWGTGHGEQLALSLRQVNSMLKSLKRRMDLRAEVIPLWGPIG